MELLDKQSLPKNSEPISFVCKTFDYDWFKFMDGNRKPDHVLSLMASFQRRDVPNAILCTNDGYIVDGQNRFLARKELGLPIYYYCIDGLDIHDVAYLNSYGKNWSDSTYIEMYASLGYEEYQRILQFREMFPDMNITSIMCLLNASSTHAFGVVGSDKSLKSKQKNANIGDLKSGEYKIKDWNKSVYLANCVMQYKPFASPGVQVYKHNHFVVAMIRLLRDNQFDNNEMVRRVGMYPDMFYKCINADNYIKMLNNLWNRGRRNKVSFSY